MKVTVFKKKITPHNGKPVFYKYIGRMTTKDGDAVVTDLRFTEDCVNIPTTFPVVLTIARGGGNMSTKHETYTDKNGEEKTAERKTLWVKSIEDSEEYIDTSLDDFE